MKTKKKSTEYKGQIIHGAGTGNGVVWTCIYYPHPSEENKPLKPSGVKYGSVNLV